MKKYSFIYILLLAFIYVIIILSVLVDKKGVNKYMKVAIGQDSHSFDFSKNTDKKLILGGVVFENHVPLLGNSDADVILHSLTNAISGITCVNIIGKVSDDMCKSRDSR